MKVVRNPHSGGASCQRFCASKGKKGKSDTIDFFVGNSGLTSYYSRRSRDFRGV